MANLALQRFKQSLTVAGSRMSSNSLHQIQMVVNYMKLGRWMATNNFSVERRVETRDEVFASVAEQVRDKRVLYLEFGVFEGASMRYWSGTLRHPDSKLHGFDSFEGLPEDWDIDGPHVKGTFNVKGQIPQIDDPRVEFFKGWFNDTLPSYKVPEHEALVLVLDADLYSSTYFVLSQLRPHIKPGTFIYFDDMSRPDHEPAAFANFMRESGSRFRLIAVDYSLNDAFFECIK